MGAGGGEAAEGVADPNRVCGGHQLGDLSQICPPDGASFRGASGGFVAWAASEHERNYTDLEVLVDAGEAVDLHVNAGLFKHLTAHALFELLAEFENAPRGFPVTVVAALDDQDLVGVVDDDSGDADRVSRSVGHPVCSLAARSVRRFYLPRRVGECQAMPELAAIDKSDDRPPYRQIAAALRDAIQHGRLGPGDKLPSESELVDRYGVARMTARQAIQALKSEGLVVSEHGRGVFVRAAPVVRRLASERFARRHRDRGKAAFSVEAEKAGYTATVDRLTVTEIPVTPPVAERLGLAAGTPVVVRDRRYLANGEPVETAVSYIPADLARGTAIAEEDTGPGGIYARLEDAGHMLDHFVEEVGARMPTPDERRALQLSAGVPVITLIRTAYDTAGRAVEVCDTVKAAYAYVLEYEFPAR